MIVCKEKGWSDGWVEGMGCVATRYMDTTGGGKVSVQVEQVSHVNGRGAVLK